MDKASAEEELPLIGQDADGETGQGVDCVYLLTVMFLGLQEGHLHSVGDTLHRLPVLTWARREGLKYIALPGRPPAVYGRDALCVCDSCAGAARLGTNRNRAACHSAEWRRAEHLGGVRYTRWNPGPKTDRREGGSDPLCGVHDLPGHSNCVGRALYTFSERAAANSCGFANFFNERSTGVKTGLRPGWGVRL